MRGRRVFNRTSKSVDSAVEQTGDPKPVRKKTLPTVSDNEDDCVQRNLPPFRGTGAKLFYFYFLFDLLEAEVE